ncbi:MtrAB system histidine kinase MtrB [Rothia sp. P7208]|uniref:MtrAB system histidine kinase MtrB n=1 Tax=Rothia sp. P7208 TaxID=3402660 RepID=UPI003ACBC95C
MAKHFPQAPPTTISQYRSFARLTRPLRRFRLRWHQSLQFRAIAAAIVLLIVTFIFVGSFLSSQIANSLFRGRVDQALQDSAAGFSNVQSLLDSSDATGRSEIHRNVLRFLTVLEAGGEESEKQWVLAPNKGTSAQGFISEQSQHDTISTSDIPTELRDTISRNEGIYWQSASLNIDGHRQPVIFVGTSIRIPQNPAYGLYLVYDLSSSQTTLQYINLVVWVAFFILLLIVVTIVWYITRSVIRPISSTAITAEKLASGDLGQRVIVRGHNETARLGNSFNRMADSLENQISRLETLSTMQQRFVSDVSHELRTPLTTVRMAAEMLYDGRDEFGAAYRRPTELLYHQVDRFDALLADLLEISRFDAGSATLDAVPVQFMAVLEEVLLSVEPHLQRTGTELRVHHDHSDISVEIDHRRIERVLRNLLFNAVEHSEGQPIDVYIATSETALGVAVRDHGVGLSEEHVTQVFNRFWRADPSRKRTLGGTGLGLSIAAEDVRLHGGTLECWGRPAEGACFRMTLPLRQGEPMGKSPVRLSGDPLPPDEYLDIDVPTSTDPDVFDADDKNQHGES